MDCAKAVGARAAYPKKSVGKMKGILRVLRPLPTLIAIPTTAGTGSEVTLAAVITDGEKHHKYALMSFPLIPHYTVLDPKLTYSLPKGLTATTGMDALTHAVEANIGRSTTKETRRLALEAVKLVFQNIETAFEACRIAPTVMDGVTYDDAVMGEEIFGPVMPIITFDDFEVIVRELKNKPKPLALYLFSSNKKHINTVTRTLSYGGGCINDVIIHLATSGMSFGGVGESGMGSYHGKDGFDAFSHYKSIVDRKVWLDLPMRYQPYKSKLYETLLHIFLK